MSLACEKRNDKDAGLEDAEEVPIPIPPADAKINDEKEEIAYGAALIISFLTCKTHPLMISDIY